MIKIDLFKGGKRHAVTFSYDDGMVLYSIKGS